jgi:hypothetical protein
VSVGELHGLDSNPPRRPRAPGPKTHPCRTQGAGATKMEP